MRTVELKRYKYKNRYHDFCEAVEVLVDGESFGVETYGGEPEDNCRYRDYEWVEPLIQKVAERLGATVVVTEKDTDPFKEQE